MALKKAYFDFQNSANTKARLKAINLDRQKKGWPLVTISLRDKKHLDFLEFLKMKSEIYKPHATVEGINEIINSRGELGGLNHIDVSKVTDMSYMFYDSKFTGDISKWDVKPEGYKRK